MRVPQATEVWAKYPSELRKSKLLEPAASRFTKKKITKGLAKVYQLDLKVNQISPTFVPSNLDIAMSSITKNFRENNTFHSSHFLEIYIKLVTK